MPIEDKDLRQVSHQIKSSNVNMRLLILSNNYIGVYNFRRELVTNLLSIGSEVIIVAPNDNRRLYFDQIGCTTIDFQFNPRGVNPLKDMYQVFRYLQLLKDTKPDIVLSFTIKPNLYGGMACRWCKIPQIANITGLGSAVENPGLLQKFTTVLYRLGLKKTDVVFFQNESNLRFCLDRKMVRGKYRLIPGSGVNLQWHKPQTYPPDGSLKFIYVGRVLKEKGIDQYIDAAKYITEKYPGTEFYVMGRCDENYIHKIKSLSSSNVIKYIGRQDDVRPYIGMCHCTIHPSYYPEGMSNVLLESCAACRPIITTDRPGCGEIVNNGVSGYITKQKDSYDLIDKIEKFIHLPYEEKVQMGKEGRLRVETSFDRKIVVDAYIEEIKRLCNV